MLDGSYLLTISDIVFDASDIRQRVPENVLDNVFAICYNTFNQIVK